MQINLYVVYDKVAEEAGPVFQAVNDGVAVRQYRNLGIPVSLKNDYQLVCVGYINTTTMEVTPNVVPTVINNSVIPEEEFINIPEE